jgi:hypothetical protein
MVNEGFANNISVKYLKFLNEAEKEIEVSNFVSITNLKECKPHCLMVITSEERNIGALHISIENSAFKLNLITPSPLTQGGTLVPRENLHLKIWIYTFTDNTFNKQTKDKNLIEFPYVINSELIPYMLAKKQEFVCLKKHELAKLPGLKVGDFGRFIIGDNIYDIAASEIKEMETKTDMSKWLVCQSDLVWYYARIESTSTLKEIFIESERLPTDPNSSVILI